MAASDGSLFSFAEAFARYCRWAGSMQALFLSDGFASSGWYFEFSDATVRSNLFIDVEFYEVEDSAPFLKEALRGFLMARLYFS